MALGGLEVVAYKKDTDYYYNIYGQLMTKSRCIGYCRLHKGMLSTTILRKKKCLDKQCFHLQKYGHHPYWKEREVKKERKKQRKLEEACNNE